MDSGLRRNDDSRGQGNQAYEFRKKRLHKKPFLFPLNAHPCQRNLISIIRSPVDEVRCEEYMPPPKSRPPLFQLFCRHMESSKAPGMRPLLTDCAARCWYSTCER